MASTIPAAYQNVIQNTYSGIIDINYPDTAGSQNNLVFVRTYDAQYVIKFNFKDIITKNAYVAKLLQDHDVPVPDINIGNYNGVWYETYKLIPGKTLFEHIRNGMPQATVRQAYRNILETFAKMDQIPVSGLPKNLACAHIYDVTYNYNMLVNNRLVALCLYPVIYALNCGRGHNKGIYQCDFTPKNVIVDENGKLVSILDLDSVAICHRDFALGIMAEKWVKSGFDAREFCEMCDEITDRPVNRPRIQSMLSLTAMGKSLMWHANKNNRQK